MLKTMTSKEQQLLKRMLKKYYDHIMKHSGTLLVRFLGLHCLRVRKSHKGACNRMLHGSDRKLHFVVMGNMFNTPFEIHRRYDLKGSWVGRVTPGKHLLDPSIALKDVDFTNANENIRVGEDLKEKLVKQIESDSGFLRDNNVIDYSLLLGVHDIGAEKGSEDDDEINEDKVVVQIREQSISPTAQGQGYVSMAILQRDSDTAGTPTPMNQSQIVPGLLQEVPVHQRDLGGLLSADHRKLYFLGIIDILTPYDTKKRLEHHLKAIRYPHRGVSCCPPVFY